jgi:hypothetical protein
MKQYLHANHDKTFQESLNEQARRLREEAAKTPSDVFRDLLLRRASQVEAASLGEMARVPRAAGAEMIDIEGPDRAARGRCA